MQLPDGCVSHDEENRPLLCLPTWPVQMASAVPGAITNATSAGACGPSRITCATMRTDSHRPGMFHMYRQLLRPLFIELFAGRATFSRALQQAGFRVLSIDHDARQPAMPIVSLDLTSGSGQAILWDTLQQPYLVGIHMGLPCGTSSRARERPIPKDLQDRGVPSPPPLRSAQYPFRLPGLAPYHQAKVDSANALYKLAVKIFEFAMTKNIIVSVENPANSWLWAVLTMLTRHLPPQAGYLFNSLEKVLFHACCHGSGRRKHTAWLGTPGVYTSLSAACANDYAHEPWGVRWVDGSWVFDTSTEAAYHPLLAQRAAACVVEYVQQRGYSLTKQPRLHDFATAAQGKQSRKHAPLIPEFRHSISRLPSPDLPLGAKRLAPHLGGDELEEPEPANSRSLLSAGNREKIAFYHTPEQFVTRAQQVLHPMDTKDQLEEVTRNALDYILRHPSALIKLERKKSLLQAKLWAKQLQLQENALQGSLPTSMQKVLVGKRLLLWEKLLRKYDYDDLGVVEFMKQGVRLVGVHSEAPCYPPLVRPATLTESDLRNSALWRRKALLGKRNLALDPSHLDHLGATAAEEVELGSLEGPIVSEEEVSEHLGCSDWAAIRRFVLVQGAESKLLGGASQPGFTSSSYLKLQDVDYVASLSLEIASAVSEGQQRHGSGQWFGTCLDLSKAYKQVPIRLITDGSVSYSSMTVRGVQGSMCQMRLCLELCL